MDFSKALQLLKAGKKVTRENWNGKGMWLALQTPTETSKMDKPYIYISIVTGELVPWVASHGDLLAEDWEMIVLDRMKGDEEVPRCECVVNKHW